MKKFEFTFHSVNSELYPKPVTALVISPDKTDENTGVMLFCHGWGGNRFQHQDKMEFTADAFNLVCVSPEYRQSGYDFDPVRGLGWDIPYDAGFMQVFDTLNTHRKALELYPGVNRKRIFAYGGSQGGHIVLLSSIFAPDTFAFIYTSSAMTHLDEPKMAITGRTFSEAELSVRNVIEHAGLIRCPVFMEHGTADENVSCDTHARPLEARLRELGRTVAAKYYEGGLHSLEPAVTKLDAYKAMIPEAFRTPANSHTDDFLAGTEVKIQCGAKLLQIDWSQPPESVKLFTWKEK